eukprot:3692110-Pyramimonas_sp.AAC.1
MVVRSRTLDQLARMIERRGAILRRAMHCIDDSAPQRTAEASVISRINWASKTLEDESRGRRANPGIQTGRGG